MKQFLLVVGLKKGNDNDTTKKKAKGSHVLSIVAANYALFEIPLEDK